MNSKTIFDIIPEIQLKREIIEESFHFGSKMRQIYTVYR